MPNKLFVDFETRSPVDLRLAGAHVYAAHPDTVSLCTGYAFDDDEPEIATWTVLPDEFVEYVQAGGEVVAHNAAFELAIWNLCLVPKYGWPELRFEQVTCTMARAYAMALPGSLENCAAALGMEAKKDAAGNRLMLSYSCPRPDGTFRPFNAEDFAKIYEYCKQDIRVTQQLDKRLLQLSPAERKIWVMDQKINFRGVHCDVEAARQATVVIESEKDRLNAEMRRVTGNDVATFTANAQLTKWLREEKGVETDGVAKADVTRLLSLPDLDPVVRDALQIRQEGAKSSTAKLKAFIARADPDDQRVRGWAQYHGASTGRWAGRGLQPHNFPREKYPEYFFESLALGGEYLSLLGSPTLQISKALRGFLTAARGKILYCADFNAIEARVLAWLAGEESVLARFRNDEDVYIAAAAAIYGILESAVTEAQRQIGKVAILALGYQGGVNAFTLMGKGYGVNLAPVARDLWDRAPQERRDKAKWGWQQRGEKSGIDKREWIAAELIKLAWREANPSIVQYWHDVEDAANNAVRAPGNLFKTGRVCFKVSGSFLFCRLPSGRALCYPYAKIKDTKTPWGDTRPMLRYKTEDTTIHKWIDTAAYGGLIVENITQAVARDVLAEAMLRVEAKGWPVVLHCHDELACEVQDDWPYTVADFESIVSEIPTWAEGLPLKAKGFRDKRYRK